MLFLASSFLSPALSVPTTKLLIVVPQGQLCFFQKFHLYPQPTCWLLCRRGSYCLMMDADGATRVSDLDKLEAELNKIAVPSKLIAIHAQEERRC